MSFRVALALVAATSLFAVHEPLERKLAGHRRPGAQHRAAVRGASARRAASAAPRRASSISRTSAASSAPTSSCSRARTRPARSTTTRSSGRWAPARGSSTSPTRRTRRSRAATLDSGWENDVQVRGNTMVATFDGVNGEDSNASTCLKTRYPDASGQGVDIYTLDFDAQTAKFDVALATCIANPPGRRAQRDAQPGRHVARRSRTAAPTGRSTSSTCAATPTLRYRVIDSSKADATRSAPPARPSPASR